MFLNRGAQRLGRKRPRARQGPGAVGQGPRFRQTLAEDGIVRRCEVEATGQVAAYRSPPLADIGLGDAETPFQEAQDAGVVEDFRRHIAASAPGRNDVHRHAHTQTIRPVQIDGVGRVLAFDMIFIVRQDRRTAKIEAGRFGIARRRRGRRHVVEKAVVFIEIDDQNGFGPDRRIGRQGIEDLGGIVRALIGGGRVRMLGIGRRRDDPRHLRQLVRGNVRLQSVEASRRQRPLDKRGLGGGARRRGQGLTESLETDDGIVGKIVFHQLIDLEADAGGQQAFGIGGPGIAAVAVGIGAQAVIGVVDRRPVVQAPRVVRPRPDVEPVGIGAQVHGAVIGVAHGEGFGQGVLERNVLTREVAHGMVVLAARPLAHAAVVPGRLPADKTVRGAVVTADGEVLSGVQAERRDQVRFGVVFVGLDENGAAGARPMVRGGNDETVAETAHPVQCAEIVVESAVFLSQDDDMLDIKDRAGPGMGRDFERPRQRRVQSRRAAAAKQGLQEFAAVMSGHQGILGRADRKRQGIRQLPPICDKLCILTA